MGVVVAWEYGFGVGYWVIGRFIEVGLWIMGWVTGC
jgi:hypothetical protein